MKTQNKSRFPNIPAVPGYVYYLTIGSENRTLICCGTETRKRVKTGKPYQVVILNDLKSSYVYEWDATRFSYMLRQRRWKIPEEAPKKVEVEHKVETKPAFRSRDYSEEDFAAAVDDIDDVEF
jgi:hypothetical protein